MGGAAGGCTFQHDRVSSKGRRPLEALACVSFLGPGVRALTEPDTLISTRSPELGGGKVGASSLLTGHLQEALGATKEGRMRQTASGIWQGSAFGSTQGHPSPGAWLGLAGLWQR